MIRPFLVTAMLSGGHREDKVPDAVRSASPFTDHFMFVDTGASAQKALAILTTMPETRGRHTVVQFPGEFHCTAGRNFCLEQAAQLAKRLGHDEAWCMVLDTDERILHRDADIRRFLSMTPADVVLVKSVGAAQYCKDRFFRLPAAGRFEGRVHEAYVAECVKREVMPYVRFVDMPKTVEEQRASSLVVERECRVWIDEEPGNARPYQYLAMTLVALDRASEAPPYFARARELSPHPEVVGWCAYSEATCWAKAREFDKAIAACLEGLAAAPQMPELHWQIAVMCAHKEDWGNALTWASTAIAVSPLSNLQTHAAPRETFRFVPASYHAPWQIRSLALERMGYHDEAKQAAQMIDVTKRIMEEAA